MIDQTPNLGTAFHTAFHNEAMAASFSEKSERYVSIIYVASGPRLRRISSSRTECGKLLPGWYQDIINTARKDGAVDLDAVKRAVASVPDVIHEQAH